MTAFRDRLSAFAQGKASIDDVVSAASSEMGESGTDERTLLEQLQTEEMVDALDADQRTLIAAQVRAAAAAVRDDKITNVPADEDRTVVTAPSPQGVRVGSVIKNRFELVELLGEGGMGKVFKAVDRVRRDAGDRDSFVALKVLGQAFSRLEVSTIALQREAKKALSLSHPNIVRVYDFDRDESTVFMTMELLSGKSLDTMLRAPDFQGLPIERALQIVRPIAAALAHAHESGLVHSDFKPNNVFLTATNQVKVIDFGIARTVKQTDSAEEATLFDVGELRALTPPYASPEQIEGLEPDPRDDIYALACVTYELLTGRHPFDRMSSLKAMTQGRQPEPIKGLDKRQWRALAQALAFQRNLRTPSVAQFMEAFSLAQKPGGGRWKLFVTGGVAAFIAAAGTATYLMVHKPAPHPTMPLPPNTGIGETSSPSTSNTSTPTTSVPPGSETAGPSTPTIVTPPPVPPTPPAAPLPATLAEINAIVRLLPCSLLTSELSKGVVELQGFAHSEGDVTALSGKLKALPGITSVWPSVSLLKDAYCQPVDVARPYVFAGVDSSSAIAVRPTKSVFTEGDPLILDIAGDHHDGYYYVDYYDALGNVVHFMPRPSAQDNYLKADARSRLGTGGKAGEWIVSPPYGRDLVVVIKVPEPLSRQPRKEEVEMAADYLPDLRQKLARLAERYGNDAIVANYALVSTQPK